MHPDEPVNIIRFATALKVLCGSSIEVALLPRAEGLLREYLLTFRKIYGVEAMKPNFHWSTHICEQVLDYGPVYNFWAFLSERLNKILKSQSVNNWIGGQVEITMMRTFARSSRLNATMTAIARRTDNDIVKKVLDLMITQDSEGTGTLGDALVSDELSSGTRVQLGTPVVVESIRRRPTLSDAAMAYMRDFYNTAAQATNTNITFAVSRQVNAAPGAITLNRFCTLYHYAFLDGRRVIPTSEARRQSADSALVKVNCPGAGAIYGEVISIFSHTQEGIPSSRRLFAEFWWLKELELSPVNDDPWHEFPELDVRCFELNAYHPSTALPPVLPFDSIICAIARGVVETTDPPMWITTSLDRTRSSTLTCALLPDASSSTARHLCASLLSASAPMVMYMRRPSGLDVSRNGRPLLLSNGPRGLNVLLMYSDADPEVLASPSLLPAPQDGYEGDASLSSSAPVHPCACSLSTSAPTVVYLRRPSGMDVARDGCTLSFGKGPFGPNLEVRYRDVNPEALSSPPLPLPFQF
ncbi:hypothetical protein CONPUDRAFT_159705 [Coniophora puteana RWD-64-598 SS2]|uniref:Uncharacterized protein n=1 Tax=Coniophora puteana (strain RWD-64-598) TaxID=741705 RepID=A0A5M3M7Q5_CONPW|nr:uncharacterized protein CONPUDRAFT_159705 [Coniophora puteana RWD-64-598 SS2]EIW74936.1 hypothetical protein CONPUDRAFT_159705 [Coniophora puteana RWD-64-598 SS2]